MSLTHATFSESMRAAFTEGSGVDAGRLKLVLTVMTVSVAAAFFLWLITGVFENYRQDQLKQEEVIEACVKLGVLFMLIVWVLV